MLAFHLHLIKPIRNPQLELGSLRNGDYTVINKLIRKILPYLNVFIFDSGDYTRTVFLAGTGRSGTTWVEELINAQNDFRLMFEPFHSRKVQLLRNWNYRQYLRPGDRNEQYLMPATAILSGKVRNKWIDKYNRNFFPRRRLIKDIRAQHILRWMFSNFPDMPIILLLRHPCAVANSKLKLGWETHLEDFLAQNELMEDFLHPYEDVLREAGSDFEKHILMWCVENYVPLMQFSRGELLIVFYEDICRNPALELTRILEYIGKDFSPAFMKRLSVPSTESRSDSAILSGTDLIRSWRKNISDEQIKVAVDILTLFALNQLYDESDLPLVNSREVLNLYSQ